VSLIMIPAKRPREEYEHAATSPPAALSPPSASGDALQKQYIETRGENDPKVVKNSPYGTSRNALGWGTPFQPAPKCTVDGYPNIHIGISSLNGVPGKDREMPKLMAQYVKKFQCLEHCYPYHRMCDPHVWDSWRAMVQRRPEFVFTIKANQYLTHTRRLEMDEDLAQHIENFFVQRVPLLGVHLGPVLVQLPPNFDKNDGHVDRIRAVAARIPSSVRIAVEFRHKSWFTDDVYDLLKELNWGLVITHNEDIGESPFVITNSSFLYVRLHGAVSQYVGDYGPILMLRWAEIIAKFVQEDSSRHVYFFLNNNESQIGGLTSSIVDASSLAQSLTRLLPKGTAAPSQPASQQPASTAVVSSTPPKAPPVDVVMID
jgi:uncharacterized protein YecE (DUF72 family)